MPTVNVSVYETLEDRLLAAPEDSPSTHEEFQEYQKSVEQNIRGLERQGITVCRVIVKGPAYLAWKASLPPEQAKQPGNVLRSLYASTLGDPISTP